MTDLLKLVGKFAQRHPWITLAVALFFILPGIAILAQGSQTDSVSEVFGTIAPHPTVTAPVPVERDWPQVASPSYSVQVFMWWDLETGHRDLDLVQELGFGWIKQRISWRDIESIEKGKFDWWRPDFVVDAALENNLDLIILLDHQPYWSQADGGAIPMTNSPPANLKDFADFCRIIAGRYRGQVAAYQIWNEPNLAREW